MRPRNRKPNDISQQAIPLALLGLGLVTTNNSITFIDDEATILGVAARPLREMLGAFFSGAGRHEHPPLYDILLHFWLRATGGDFNYLRLPSVLFFMAGLFLLGRASRHFTGKAGSTAVIWLGVLFPFGFNFSRLAAWYSFSFLLVAGVTLAYLKYLENPARGSWAALFIFCLCLIWTNYFAWAILACLALDQFLRHRSKETAAPPKIIVGTAGLLIVCFVPLLGPFRAELSHGVNFHQGAVAMLANLAFNVYSLFVSESMAPWFWWFSVPAGLAVMACVVFAVWWTPRAARRFLIYAGALLVAMALLGILQTKYLLLLAPWVLLPIECAIESTKPRWATFALAGSLLVIGGIGWYGIYSKRFYSAPRFIEPWQEVAGDAAAKIRTGATVIADHPSFLFYLTYYLHVPPQEGAWKFQGVLPDDVRDPHVFSPQGWLAAGHPASGKMVLVRGGRDPGGNEPIDEAAAQLDHSCGSINSRLRMRDEGYKWKQRFFPQLGEPQWRIEIRDYDCDSTNSKQIYSLPPR